MEEFQEEGKSIGLIFDVSIRHAKNGRRIIDTLKKQMISLVREFVVDDADSFYLYHPDLWDTVNLHGDQISCIGNYDTDGWKINLHHAFRQTIYVLLNDAMTLKKYVFFITDRVTDVKPIEKALYLNEKELLESKFIIIGVGDLYDRSLVSKLSEENGILHIHVDQPEDLTTLLFKEKISGRKDLQCQADERCEHVQLTSGHNCSVPRTIRLGDEPDAKLVQIDTEQLLQTDSCGRLLAQSGIWPDVESECSEECSENEAGEHSESDSW
jgi:hypothetical protein